MKFITIITPTYNRAVELNVLYQSLLSQDNQNFVWMIVDDGSVDNTKEIVEQFILESKIEIIYKQKKNGGKHTALNCGIQDISTPLTIIVDSDDRLTADAISIIYEYWKKYEKEDNLCGFSFLKVYFDGNIVVGIEKEESIDTHVNFRIRENRPGDMAEVFYTEVLKQYPFPTFENERFLSEDVVWISIGMRYKTVYINKPIYVCEYLKDGLSANDKPMKFASPLGSMLRGKVLMYKECGVITNIKGAIIYNCYKQEIKGETPQILKLDNSYQKILVSLLKILGVYYNKKWKKS